MEPFDRLRHQLVLIGFLFFAGLFGTALVAQAKNNTLAVGINYKTLNHKNDLTFTPADIAESAGPFRDQTNKKVGVKTPTIKADTTEYIRPIGGMIWALFRPSGGIPQPQIPTLLSNDMP